ncbi:hypothetical protein VTH06DRAFT_7037 [Thermothelomyces fergusii]
MLPLSPFSLFQPILNPISFPSPSANDTGPYPAAAGSSLDVVTRFPIVERNKLLTTLVFGPALAIFLWFCVAYHTSPLKQYPGPFLAGWTNLWRVWQVYSGEYAPRIKKLHEKYGPVVRIGPNLLDLDIPDLFRVIYGTDGKWIKSDFYKNNSMIHNGKITYHMFSEIDPAKHALIKRPIARYYSVSAVQATEHLMDSVLREFLDTLQNRYVEVEKTCKFGDWLNYYAWDFLGMVTFSSKFGYMEHGCDFDGSLAIADKMITYFTYCGQMPWTDYLLDKNPICRIGPPNIEHVTRIAVEKLTSRLKGEDDNFREDKPDYLQYFIESKSTHPDLVDDTGVIGYLLLNLLAGADTTAIAMRALFYFVLKDPRVFDRLQAEVRASFAPFEPAAYAKARALPYLEAVVKETLRYHPPLSMAMERIVPAEGLQLPDGSVVPAGQTVGMNPYVLGRNRVVFGDDADRFHPDRWLRGDDEAEDVYKGRMQRWGQSLIAFGGGSRICVGRHIGTMEIYKVVATLLATFDIALEDPDARMQLCSKWFYQTKGVVCKLRPRSS